MRYRHGLSFYSSAMRILAIGFQGFKILGEFYQNLQSKRQLKRSLGHRGEKAAERFLRRKGYIIVGRRVRHSLGEIDLIAVHDRTVVFVEVKTRQSEEYGHPAEAVDEEKQARITRAASAFLKKHQLLEQSVRFDVVAIIWPSKKSKPTIEHFENAFEASGRFQLFG